MTWNRQTIDAVISRWPRDGGRVICARVHNLGVKRIDLAPVTAAVARSVSSDSWPLLEYEVQHHGTSGILVVTQRRSGVAVRTYAPGRWSDITFTAPWLGGPALENVKDVLLVSRTEYEGWDAEEEWFEDHPKDRPGDEG